MNRSGLYLINGLLFDRRGNVIGRKAADCASCRMKTVQCAVREDRLPRWLAIPLFIVAMGGVALIGVGMAGMLGWIA